MNLSKKLVYQLRVTSRKLGYLTETWIIRIHRVKADSVKWPYELTAELEYQTIDDQWDDHGVLIPSHKEEIPGVHLTPVTGLFLPSLKAKARERALIVAHCMTREDVPFWEEKVF